MPEWVEDSFADYAMRMPHKAAIKLVRIKSGKRSKSRNISQLLCDEAKRIRAALPQKCRRIVLDERGRQITTISLADSVFEWMKDGCDIAFIIGGADGLDPGIKNSADEILALSLLTLPHGLVRVILAEQLYRAVSIIEQHPYHRK